MYIVRKASFGLGFGFVFGFVSAIFWMLRICKYRPRSIAAMSLCET